MAVLLLSAVAATIGYVLTTAHVMKQREVGLFIIDLLLAGAVLWVALVAERFWPLWISAILILSLLLQLAIWYASTSYRSIYLILHASSAYPTLLLLWLGTLRFRERRRRSHEQASSSSTAAH